MHFYAEEYSKALGRTITYQDIPLEPWRKGLVELGLPVHLANHLATMADLHRAGRYDRMSDDDDFWLYVVFNCASEPQVTAIQNPARLEWEALSKIDCYRIGAEGLVQGVSQ